MRLRPVFNKRLGQWNLCHDQWCKPGETSIVATILTTGDEQADATWAEVMCDNFNVAQELKKKALA